MIRHLNPEAFRSFGAIVPPGGLSQKPNHHSVFLAEGSVSSYRSVAPLWLGPESGLTVLSVSLDQTTFEDFYLDKPVRLGGGIYFRLAGIGGKASVQMSGISMPLSLGQQVNSRDFAVRPKARVECLYTLFYQEKEAGFVFGGEAHPMAELLYVDKGSLHSVADGQDLILQQGDIVLYGPNQWHMQYADIGVAPRFVTISFVLSGEFPNGLFNRRIHAPQEALTLLTQILREQERADGFTEDMILSLLTQLLIVLQRHAGSEPGKLKASHALHNENEIIRRAQQYISTHVQQKLSVPLVAKQVDVSPSYLTALFHKHLQIAPGEYIRRIKLQESKQMIRENAMNFTEIANVLQYSTVHHFSRQFKEKFGITPSEYAKSVR